MYSSFNARAVGLNLSGVETIDLAAATGFEGVDLLVRDIRDAGESIPDLRSRLLDRGLRPGAFPLPINWRGTREEFERDLADLPSHAACAAELGLTRTGTWVMPETTDLEADAERRAIELHRERLSKIAEVLGGFEIRLGLEAIGAASFRSGRGRPFIHRLSQIEDILGPIKSIGPNVGFLVDGFHLYASDEPRDFVPALSPEQIVWVHLADLPRGASPIRDAILDHDRGLPGEHGVVDCGGLLATLLQVGYEGPVTAEPLPLCRSLRDLAAGAKAEALLKSIRRFWPVKLV